MQSDTITGSVAGNSHFKETRRRVITGKPSSDPIPDNLVIPPGLCAKWRHLREKHQQSGETERTLRVVILSFFFFKNGDVFGSVRQKTVSLFPQDCAALKDLYSSRHTRTLTTIAFYWHSFPLRSQHQLKSHNYVLTELSRLTPAHTEGPVCQDIWCFSPLQSLLKDQPAMHAISDMLIFKRAAEAKWNLSLLLG